ncbi:MAG: hypothetical protein H7647_09665, partial [Candidatus Heimdallarchaeota archaeon]|nr:hypothetical protein [Candidatus Heimdallarchaeota archaeon]MCK4254695.1 hypothetical protein [Candidatus Heimdallarchaeota archaeon]
MTKWAEEIDSEIPLLDYPRPQYVRDGDWLNLNGLWDYAIRKKKIKAVSKFDGKILVPFPLESALSGGEFGGLGFKIQNHIWKTRIYWSYKKYKTKRELITNYTKLIKKTKTLIKQGLSAAVYTQTT